MLISLFESKPSKHMPTFYFNSYFKRNENFAKSSNNSKKSFLRFTNFCVS